MKKTILKRSVASTLSFLMAFSTAVPNSVVYAEESGIESEIAQDYVATLSQTQNGTTSFVTDGNKTKLQLLLNRKKDSMQQKLKSKTLTEQL